MPIFNNTKILKSGSDITLGAVYAENENFNFDVFKRLIRDKIWELIDSYVDDRLSDSSNKVIKTKEDILFDLSVIIQNQLGVAVSDGSYDSLVSAITESDSYSRFMIVMANRFSYYENMILATENPVPVYDAVSGSKITEEQKQFFSEEAVKSVYEETNIIDFINNLSDYGITYLY